MKSKMLRDFDTISNFYIYHMIISWLVLSFYFVVFLFGIFSENMSTSLYNKLNFPERVIVNTVSKFRTNFRVIGGTIFKIDPNLYKGLDKRSRSYLPKKEDGIFPISKNFEKEIIRLSRDSGKTIDGVTNLYLYATRSKQFEKVRSLDWRPEGNNGSKKTR
jgi:hypothetical protein